MKRALNSFNGKSYSVDERVLRWIDHVERMDEHCMLKRASMAGEG